MSETSRKAFREIENQLPDKRKVVYQQIKKKPNSSFYSIAYSLGWDVNKVSNRFKELLDSGLIKTTGKEQRGKFERDLFSVETNIEIIKEVQNKLYVGFTETKSQLESDYHRCETKEGKDILKRRILYCKNKISNLKLVA